MNNENKREKKATTTIRLPPSIKGFANEKAADENIFESTAYRNIFYAGLKSLYDVEIRNNKIVTK